MKKQLLLIFAALAFSLNANAVVLDATSDGNITIFDNGSAAVEITNSDNDVLGLGISGWTGAALIFSAGSNYLFEYVGKEAANFDSLRFVLGGNEINNKQAAFQASVEETQSGADSWYFEGCPSFASCTPGTGEIVSNNSPNVWMAIDPTDPRAVLLAYDDITRDGDFDDLVIRISAVPVPAAVWLFGTAMLGLFGLRRKSKTGAVAA
jgi:hypothetical protein